MPNYNQKLTVLFAMLTFILSLASVAHADSIRPNRTYEKSSLNGAVTIKMTPAVKYGEMGSGVARQTDSGRKLWSVDWYARRVMVLDDGEGLIRFGPWATDRKGLSDLAVAFYRRGKLLAAYRVRHLLKNPRSIKRTVSHYFYLAGKTPIQLSSDQKVLTLRLIDGSVHRFDTATGQRL